MRFLAALIGLALITAACGSIDGAEPPVTTDGGIEYSSVDLDPAALELTVDEARAQYGALRMHALGFGIQAEVLGIAPSPYDPTPETIEMLVEMLIDSLFHWPNEAPMTTEGTPPLAWVAVFGTSPTTDAFASMLSGRAAADPLPEDVSVTIAARDLDASTVDFDLALDGQVSSWRCDLLWYPLGPLPAGGYFNLADCKQT
jgi:hypothetical protein